MLTDKTLVAWVRLADLDQRAGSLLTLEAGGDRFDGIVYGEVVARRWMAGSDGLARTQSAAAQAATPAETAGSDDLVQVGVVYRGRRVLVLRDAVPVADYEVDAPLSLGDEAFAVLGLRHVAAGRLDAIAGHLLDARVYATALSAAQLAALEPGVGGDLAPWAWWYFGDGCLAERTGRLPHTRACGSVAVDARGLHLDGASYLVSAATQPVPAWRGATRGADLVHAARALREQLLADRHRPTYHLVAPEGHCAPFDPNACIWWKGRYHLMYIVQTEKGHCFGHVSSTDLVHWRQHPLALEPGDGDSGIFSGGCALDRDGVPTITYWGLGDPGGICVAQSTDALLETWTKHPANPVVSETQPGLRAEVDADGGEVVYGAADPSAIWVEDGRYHLLTGNLLVLREYGQQRGLPEHLGDTLYLLTSPDLETWRYEHPFYASRRDWTRADEDDMCPDFFPLPSSPDGGPPSDRHLLLFISHNLGCQYYIGRYADQRFEPEVHGRMTWVDNAFFAPESLLDPRGRRLMWSWIFDGRGPEARAASAWSGTMSLPRVLWLGDDGALRLRPTPELQMLRYDESTLEETVLQDGMPVAWEGVRGDALELELDIDPGTASRVGVVVGATDDGAEATPVFHDAAAATLTIDATASSLTDGPRNVEAGPFALPPGETLHLRVFVDRSVVEAFANDRQGVMRRIYPSRPDATGVRLFAEGGAARVRAARAWTMAPAHAW